MNGNATDPTEKRLSNRQREALPHIAAADSIAEGARMADVHRATLYRWMEDDDFRAELSRVRTEMADLAQAEMQGQMLKAAAVIDQGLEGNISTVQLRAALVAINSAIKIRYGLNLERRLNRIDDALSMLRKESAGPGW